MDGREQDEVLNPMSEAPSPTLSLFGRAAGRVVDHVAALDVDVLVCGERGVGKERLARELHDRSQRRAALFLVVNCTVGPVERLEAEVFGVAPGGAAIQRRERPGALDEAAHGTVYLDEIEAMPLSAQVRLVQALEDQEYLRLGATEPTRLSARLIAAAVGDPARLVALGRFRADLYDRLRVVTITIPPLRERRDEIAGLVHGLMARYTAQYGTGPVTLRPHTVQRLVEHSWPGNIPQLENVVERIVLHGSDRWVADELDAAAHDGPATRRHPARAVRRPDGLADPAPGRSAR